MNLALFRSRHGFAAAAIVLACVVWSMLGDQSFGSRDTANVGFLLATGWLTALAFVVLALYAVRRAAHRSGLSLEFLREVGVERLERAQSALRGLENATSAGALMSRGAVRKAAAALLRDHGVHRVLRVQVERDTDSGGYRVVVLPREPLGRLSKWMHAHLYYGLAAALLVLFHGGGRIGSSMGLLLNLLSGVVLLTGIGGIVLWTFGPTWLTRRERELSVEKAFALHEHYARKVSQQRDVVGSSSEPGPARDLRVLEAQQARVDREWGRLRTLRMSLHAWRAVHVPCSVVLLGLVVAHVFSIWYY